MKITGGAPAPPTPGGHSLVPSHQRLSQLSHPILPPNKPFLLSPHLAQGRGVVSPLAGLTLPGLPICLRWYLGPPNALPVPRQAPWGAGPGKRHLSTRSQLQHS